MMTDDKKINASAYILIGGLSRRFGSPKWKAKVNNKRMVDHMWDICGDFENRFVVGKSEPEDLPYPFISDVLDVQTPLNGIYSALTHSTTHWNFIISCDLPLMDPKVIQSLWKDGNHNADAMVPIIGNQLQPTCTFYHKRIENIIPSQVETGNLSIHGLLDSVQADTFKMDEFAEVFMNMNTLDD